MTQKIEKKEIEKLAALARITIPENEIEKVRKDIETILAYVDQINDAHDDSAKSFDQSATEPGGPVYNSGVKNVMREDGEPHEPGKFTGALLAAAPKTEKGYVKVKKIL